MLQVVGADPVAPVTVHETPPGVDDAVYPVITVAVPSVGALHDTVAFSSPADAVTLIGGPGVTSAPAMATGATSVARLPTRTAAPIRALSVFRLPMLALFRSCEGVH